MTDRVARLPWLTIGWVVFWGAIVTVWYLRID